ncbi:MAG: hypothetical protein FJZ93_10845 [Chloroflexi bacterium]|nr:hypothetical protein [Chloroflexota bacterium]
MDEPRQKPIPVTRQERASLEQHKQRYEGATGDTGDWGKFLGTIALLGLAAAGIYALVKATERSQQSVDVCCCRCSRNFVMAVPEGTGRAVYTSCPHCGIELVVDLGTSR